jgi:hypothetical protein
MLVINVTNTAEVARCLRGHCQADGTPDWDTRNVAALTGGTTDQIWCDWGPNPCAGGVQYAGANAGPPDGGTLSDAGAAVVDGGVLQAGVPFTPSADTVMCTAKANSTTDTTMPAMARPLIHLGPLEYVTLSLAPMGTCPSARLVADAVEGTIDFIQFGQAETLKVISPNFKVNFGERLQANFHAVLQDERVVRAINTLQMVQPAEIGGATDGFFDFILDRGRAAQPFP